MIFGESFEIMKLKITKISGNSWILSIGGRVLLHHELVDRQEQEIRNHHVYVEVISSNDLSAFLCPPSFICHHLSAIICPPLFESQFGVFFLKYFHQSEWRGSMSIPIMGILVYHHWKLISITQSWDINISFNVNHENREKLNVTVFDSDVVIIIGVNRNTGISHLKPIPFTQSRDINRSFNFKEQQH